MGFDEWNTRVRLAVQEYKLDINGNVYWNFITFRHISKPDQDKTLDWFRKDFPKLYSLLMELQMFDEQYPSNKPLLEIVN